MAADIHSSSERQARPTMFEIQNKMLLALLKEFRDLDDPEDADAPALFAFRIAESNEIDASKSVLKLCIDGLANDGLITAGDSFTTSEPDFFCFLTAKGVIRAESIEAQPIQLATPPETPAQASTTPSFTTFGFATDSAPFGIGTFASSDVVPAAGRFVNSKDNQEIEEIIGNVAELISAIKEDRTNDFDDKEGRVGELLTLDFILSQDQVSVPFVETIMRETVQYLAGRFKDVAIGQIALHVLKLAAKAFGFHL